MSHSPFPLTASLGHDLVVLDDVDSTNRYLAGHPGDPARLTIAVTTNQTAGRGRMGRSWVSPAGAGLAISVALPAPLTPTPLTPHYLQLVSLVTGGCVAEAIEPEVTGRVEVKWPNDVLVEGKKVAGVLGEITTDHRVIIGVGLNISIPPAMLPTPQATSLHLHGANPDGLADRWMERFVFGLLERVGDVAAGMPSRTREWLVGWLSTLGHAVTVEAPDGSVVTGVAESLGDDGALQIRTGSGQLLSVTAGDVHHLRHKNTEV